MAKFLYLFITALCLAQTFQRTLAESEDEDDNIVIRNALKLEMADEFQELSDTLMSKYYDPDVQKFIKATKITITRIFKFAKEEIADLADDSSAVEVCSIMASEELEDLIEKTKSDVDNCIATGAKLASEIIEEAEQDIMDEALSVIDDILLKVVKCQKFREEDIWASSGINYKDLKKVMETTEKATISASAVSQLLLQQVAEKVGKCLEKVQVDALMNTEHVTDELKTCIGEV